MAPSPCPPPSPGELCSASASLRAAAVEALGASPRVEHLGALFAALDDPAARVRAAAVEALADLARAHKQARGTVRRVLLRRLGADPEGELRRRIAGALSRLNATTYCGPPPGAPSTGDARGATPGAKAARPGKPARRRSSTAVASPRDERNTIEEGRFHYEYFDDDDNDVERYRYDYDYREAPTLPASDGLAPAGPVEVLVQRLTQELHGETKPASHQPKVAALLTPAAYGRLRGLVKQAPIVAPTLSGAAGAFARRHRLTLDLGAPVDALPGLSLMALLRREGVAPFVEPDWPALKGALLRALSCPPPGDEAELEVIVLAFHEAVVGGPEGLRGALLRGTWHEGWAPLACWALSAELGDWRERERLARGSRLSARNMREASRGGLRRALFERQGAVSGSHYAPQAVAVLASGGGSLRRLDYPEFRVAGGVALVELSPEQEQELSSLVETLTRLRHAVSDRSRGPEGLLRELAPSFWAELDEAVRGRLAFRLKSSTIAYVGLRRVPSLSGARLRRSHLVDYWQRPGPRPHEAARAGPGEDPDDRALEGLVLALLSELHQPYCSDSRAQARLKALLIESARAAAYCYAFQPLPALRRDDLASAAGLIDAFLRCFDHAPRELAQALGLDPAEGLPRPRGGQEGSVEGRFRKLCRGLLRGPRAEEGERTVYLCKPLSKEQALARGALGRDCSSWSVPLRALSPHHVYYGIFDEGGRQLPGYMTVYEAWGRTRSGPPRPVLCLETVNEPKGLLGGVQQDLLLIFEAIARSRGLHPGLVLITNSGTWNYANGAALARCRRVRAGEAIWLAPADPVVWRAYQQASDEARYYSAFAPGYDGAIVRPEEGGAGGQRPVALLAPFDPERDIVQPENLAEAHRIAAMPARTLTITCRDEGGEAVGFISG